MKYLKYKTKYLNLKNTYFNFNQVGGAVASLNILKNINLFKDDKIAQFLNPFHGAILYKTSYIKNYYLLLDDDKYNNYKYNNYIKQFFYIIPGSFELNPTKNIKDLEKTKIKQFEFFIYIGMYIVYNYILMQIKLENKSEMFVTDNIIRNLNTAVEEQINKMTQMDIGIDIINLININGEFDLHYSHILLSLLWSIAENKEGIAKYYEGVNKIFNIINTINKKFKKHRDRPIFLDSLIFELSPVNKKFNDAVYIKSDINLRDADFFDTFVKLFDSFYLFQTGTVEFGPGVSYSDCGETSLRNFINVICYNQETNNFDISKLEILGAIDSVKDYYTKYNNINLQHNGRIDWARITIDIPNVKYNSPKNMEISDGINTINELNMLTVIKHLFRNIRTWDDFNRLLDDPNFIKQNINEKGMGKINIRYNNNSYIWHFQNRHFQLSEENEVDDSNIRYKSITRDYEERFILKSHNIRNLIDYMLSGGVKDKNHIFTESGFLYFDFISTNLAQVPTLRVADNGRTYIAEGYRYPIIELFNTFFTRKIFNPDNPKHKYIYSKIFTYIMNLPFDTIIIPEIKINTDILLDNLHERVQNLYINSNDINSNDKVNLIGLFDKLYEIKNFVLNNVIININDLSQVGKLNLNKFTIKGLSLIHTALPENIEIPLKISTNINNINNPHDGDFPDIFQNNESINKLLLTTEYKINNLPTELIELYLTNYNRTLDLSTLRRLKELYLYNFIISPEVTLRLPNNSNIEVLALPSSRITDIVELFKSSCKRVNQCLPNIKTLIISNTLKDKPITDAEGEHEIENWIRSKTKKPQLNIKYM